MASLYQVKVKAIDIENKSVLLTIDSIHPDAMYFTDNLAFALRLLHDSATGDSPIAKSFDAHCLFDDNWLTQNTKGYISKSELREVKTPEIETIKTDGKESFWFGETDEASATLFVQFTSNLWLRHLSAGSSWKSTAYPSEVDFLDRAPIDPSTDTSAFSDDYGNSGGWISVKSHTLKPSESSWPDEVFIPIYTEKSYRRISKISGAELTKAKFDELLFKTVFALDRNGFKSFGILVPKDGRYGILGFSKGGYSGSYFDPADVLTFGAAEFNANDTSKAVKFAVEA
ncbi:hypothetical protein [Flavobacterium sp.]|uniref:hypothetical protein n=1 Tax=Flavobacterium sp. TaxID=239 RepID=UPI001227985D|nr:hypothetical protein [Flavobacterium sp.]RZJ70299.1 MAG: hypothetical protein EOO49_14305 [Flavobacterium sp.]